jgi:hypothetical protein
MIPENGIIYLFIYNYVNVTRKFSSLEKVSSASTDTTT